MLCSICKKNQINPIYKPFCSDRCKKIDLANWLLGNYSINTPVPANINDLNLDEFDEDIVENEKY